MTTSCDCNNYISFCIEEVTGIFSVFGPVVKIPSETFPLRPRAVLHCALSIAPGVNYATQWSGPDDAGIIDPATNVAHYAITKGNILLLNGSESPGTTLTIHKLSYQDAGVYICSGRSLAGSNEEVPSWVSAKIDLQLDSELVIKIYFGQVSIVLLLHDMMCQLLC